MIMANNLFRVQWTTRNLLRGLFRDKFRNARFNLLGYRCVEANNLFADLSFLINKDDGRKSVDSVSPRDFFWSDGDGVGDVEGLRKMIDRLRIALIHAQPHYREPLPLICFVEMNQMRNGFPTRATPGGPEVDEKGLPLVVRETHFLAGERLQRKLWGQRRPLFFFRTVGKKNGESQAHPKDESETTSYRLQNYFSPRL